VTAVEGVEVARLAGDQADRVSPGDDLSIQGDVGVDAEQSLDAAWVNGKLPMTNY